jgi:hypothetical protein
VARRNELCAAAPRALRRPARALQRSPDGRQLDMAQAHSPDVLIRNIFALMLIGIVIEIVLMVILPRIGF